MNYFLKLEGSEKTFARASKVARDTNRIVVDDHSGVAVYYDGNSVLYRFDNKKSRDAAARAVNPFSITVRKPKVVMFNN